MDIEGVMEQIDGAYGYAYGVRQSAIDMVVSEYEKKLMRDEGDKGSTISEVLAEIGITYSDMVEDAMEDERQLHRVTADSNDLGEFLDALGEWMEATRKLKDRSATFMYM